MRQLIRFGILEAKSCVFAAGVFGLLLASHAVPRPIHRYDALLVGCVLLTLVLWWRGIETTREVLVIALFHVTGLVLELFKIRMGSWAYPEPALTKVAGAPLYSGFMYAAVGSYMCQAWRRLDLALIGYRPVPTAIAAAAVYLNFFTHHWLPDLRVLAAAGLVAATWRTWVLFRVAEVRYRMPLAVSFLLIGGFLWLAENAATLLGAWRYPQQVQVWQLVHVSKFGSWALLVSVSFVLVAALKHWEARDLAGRDLAGREGAGRDLAGREGAGRDAADREVAAG